MASYLVFGALHVLRARRTLKRFDVINTHFSIPTGPLGHFASFVLGRPHVLTIIGGDIYDPTKRSSPHRFAILRALNRYLISRADEVIAISSDTAARARDLHGVRRPIDVVNYGFEPRQGGAGRVAGRRDDGDFVLVAVGRLVPRKGFDHLIRAMSYLPGNVRTRIIGDGPEEPSLRALARDLGVQDRVHLVGFLPNERVLEELGRADCFVLSSLHEGLGIVVQEAMYLGLPIVSTNNGGQVDLLEHGRNALLVDPGRPEELASAIDRIRLDKKLANDFGRANQKDLESLYISENSAQYTDVFLRCLRENSGREPKGVT
jgi:glycosyltransferase involved in cell wall biosynthesis